MTDMKSLAQRADTAEIRGRLEALGPADAGQWGVMNVVQMACHVREAFRFGSSAEVAPLLPAPLPRGVMKWIALRAPMQWPKTVQTVPELKVGAPLMEASALGFAEDKRTLMEAFEEFASLQNQTKSHPIFGAMRHDDWMRWGYLHADHHLRQFGH